MAVYSSEIDVINQTLAVLKESKSVYSRYEARVDMFEERKKRALQNTYRLGVIGVTSSGKSTLINSLLDEDLLPSAVIPSSSQLVSCRKGDNRFGVVYFEDKGPQTLSSLSLTSEVIKKYGEEQSNPCNREKVKQIEIFSTEIPFSKEIILIDSPGLDAYGFEGHEQLTLNTLLPSVDFCLFVTTCKTNSDSKTKSILNTIAQYDKPVIIIQNMADSIKPSLNTDGTIRKTVKDVAEEHRNRVEKIVKESKMHSQVIILQYSAIWARNGQKEYNYDLLQMSGYNDLVSAIEETFRQLRPKAENRRLVFLKHELEKIITEARKDGTECFVPMATFEYDGVIFSLRTAFSNCGEQINEILSSFVTASRMIEDKTTISTCDIEDAKQMCFSCSGNIGTLQMGIYKEIETLCNKLSIPTTQLFDERSSFPEISDPALVKRSITKYEWRDKKGLLNGGKRVLGFVFGQESWGREEVPITKKILDIEGSKQSIINYLDTARQAYFRVVSLWGKQVDNAIDRLELEVTKHYDEYNARIERSLTSRVYLDVAEKLQTIVNCIQIADVQSSPLFQKKYDKGQIICSEIPRLSFDLSRLAFVVKDIIHRSVFENEVRRNGYHDNYIIGWDSVCIHDFLRQNLGVDISGKQKDSFSLGGNNFYVYPNLLNTEMINRNALVSCNVFVLVSALQHGQVISQLNNCRLNQFINPSDNLYIVVQDFQEILNAQVLNEALTSLRLIESKLYLKTNPKYLIMHSNPTYNLAALETLRRKQYGAAIVQNDELTILNDLQKSSFGYLCSTPKDSSIVISIVKSLK